MAQYVLDTLSNMTVNFPSSQSANVAPANKPADAQTLQNAFAALLRSYGTEKTGTYADTMLEILQPTSRAENATDADRNQQRRNQQQHVDRNDFAPIDQKRQNQSEERHNEINALYQDQLDRKETLRSDYQERDERNVHRLAIPAETSQLKVTVPLLDGKQPNEPATILTHSPPQQQNVSEIVRINNPSLPANTAIPNSEATQVQTSMLMPGGSVPMSMPMSAAPQTAGMQTFTLFTPSGRLGQIQDKMDEKENEDEEPVESNRVKKKQPFAVFEAIHAEALRSTRKNHARQPKEPISQTELHRITEKPTREKPTEAEPDQSRSTKTLDELFTKQEQSVSASKQGESNQANQAQYLNRIAAACEAAAQYAPIRMKINLDHLGTLTLRFYYKYKTDKLTLHFETPSQESERFIRNHLDGLRTILSRRKVNIVDIEIERGS